VPALTQTSVQILRADVKQALPRLDNRFAALLRQALRADG
jgi:hypothetical protein